MAGRGAGRVMAGLILNNAWVRRARGTGTPLPAKGPAWRSPVPAAPGREP